MRRADVLLVLALAGCSAPTPLRVQQPLPPTSVVRGVVSFSGVEPKRKPVRAVGIPGFPAGGILMEDLVLDVGNHVQWAFVYIKRGLEGKSFEPETLPVEFDQAGMMYRPHVLGIRVGQPMVIRNSDPHLHYVHAFASENRGFNFGQPPERADVRQFMKPEVMVRLRCDIHPWMRAWIGVMDHPFFAVTDAAGNFEIRNLPSGKYKVGLWHEKLKAEDREIEVSGDRTVDFTCVLK